MERIFYYNGNRYYLVNSQLFHHVHIAQGTVTNRPLTQVHFSWRISAIKKKRDILDEDQYADDQFIAGEITHAEWELAKTRMAEGK